MRETDLLTPLARVMSNPEEDVTTRTTIDAIAPVLRATQDWSGTRDLLSHDLDPTGVVRDAMRLYASHGATFWWFVHWTNLMSDETRHGPLTHMIVHTLLLPYVLHGLRQGTLELDDCAFLVCLVASTTREEVLTVDDLCTHVPRIRRDVTFVLIDAVIVRHTDRRVLDAYLEYAVSEHGVALNGWDMMSKTAWTTASCTGAPWCVWSTPRCETPECCRFWNASCPERRTRGSSCATTSFTWYVLMDVILREHSTASPRFCVAIYRTIPSRRIRRRHLRAERVCRGPFQIAP